MNTRAILLVLLPSLLVTSCNKNGLISEISDRELKAAMLMAPATEEKIAKPEYYSTFLAKVNEFCARFTDSVIKRKQNDENIAISPVSVFLALSMTIEGANGETRQEILDSLGLTYQQLSTNIEFFCDSLNKIFYYESYNGDKPYGQINLTNSIWFNKTLSVKEKYLSILATLYRSYSFQVDFENENKHANDLIKEFIMERTNGLIKDGLDSDISTLAILLNTLYFKDTWSDSGDNLPYTQDKYVFRSENGESYKTSLLMGKYYSGRPIETDEYKYFYTSTYAGYNLTFIVPKGNNTLSNVMTSSKLENILSSQYETVNTVEMKEYYTKCYFPEFEAEYKGDLMNLLIEDFNIHSIFDESKADFANICDSSMYVDQVKHIAKLRVNKNGIEGTAITAVIVAGEITPIYEKVYDTFIVDRSFGYIFSAPNGPILFSGIVNKI